MLAASLMEVKGGPTKNGPLESPTSAPVQDPKIHWERHS